MSGMRLSAALADCIVKDIVSKIRVVHNGAALQTRDRVLPMRPLMRRFELKRTSYFSLENTV
jgi:hypothetical protein